MMGPYVALVGNVQRGKNTIEGSISQSVIMGDAELSSSTNDFTGSFSMPTFFDLETIRKVEEIAIPITELRLKWTYRVTKMVALGAGIDTSVWQDVQVPPSVIPGQSGAFLENTLVLVGIAGAVELTF